MQPGTSPAAHQPEQMIGAGDILRIEPLRVIPLPPYRLEPLDVLYVRARNAAESNSIHGLYPVGPEGTIDLGRDHGGIVRVGGLTTEETRGALERQGVEASVSVAQPRGTRHIAGHHVVGQDGTITLGPYGSVPVSGKSPAQARAAIEAHLARYLYRPEVSVEASLPQNRMPGIPSGL